MMSVLGAPVLAEECKKVGGNILLSPSKKKKQSKGWSKTLSCYFYSLRGGSVAYFHRTFGGRRGSKRWAARGPPANRAAWWRSSIQPRGRRRAAKGNHSEIDEPPVKVWLTNPLISEYFKERPVSHASHRPYFDKERLSNRVTSIHRHLTQSQSAQWRTSNSKRKA